MKKIYFVRRQYTPFGGVEKYIERLVKELTKRNLYEVELLHIEQPKWMPSWIKLPWYNFQVCTNRKSGIYFSSDRLTCLDIHRAGGGTHKTFLKVKGFSLNPLHPVYLILERKTLQNSKRIIAISNMVKNDIIRDYDIDPDKIDVIYNGIELETIDEKEKKERKARILQEFGIDDEVPIILYVGSGFERKGVWEMLEILSRLRTPFHAFIVGKEKRMKRYRKRAQELEIAQKVTFTGPRTDVAHFYCASDLFLFPTHYEPFGSVILEAMHYGNAVITTKQCGGGELLNEKWLMENPSDISIVSTIEELLTTPDLLEKVKSENEAIACKHSIEHNVDETIKVIEKVSQQ